MSSTAIQAAPTPDNELTSSKDSVVLMQLLGAKVDKVIEGAMSSGEIGVEYVPKSKDDGEVELDNGNAGYLNGEISEN